MPALPPYETGSLTHTDTPIHLCLLSVALLTAMQAHIDLCDLWSSLPPSLHSMPNGTLSLSPGHETQLTPWTSMPLGIHCLPTETLSHSA